MSAGTKLDGSVTMTSYRRTRVLIFGEGVVANVQVVAEFEQGNRCAVGLSARDTVVLQRETLESLGKLLQKDGFDVTLAFDLHAANARLLSIDCVDVVVGDVNALTPMLLAMIGQLQAVHPDASVILVTDTKERLELLQSERAGRVRIMVKPLDYESFLAELLHLTSPDRASTSLARIGDPVVRAIAPERSSH
jgi:CheY-like chemotaxis protein